jgi:hypothetical protein
MNDNVLYHSLLGGATGQGFSGPLVRKGDYGHVNPQLFRTGYIARNFRFAR